MQQDVIDHDETAGPGGARRAAESERRCVVTRRSQGRGSLIRMVIDPNGEVVPDLAESLPGRGLWLTARRDIVQTARDKKVFAKVAGSSAVVPLALEDRIEALLAQRCIHTLGLARRAGQVASGFHAVRDWLRGGRAALLLTAADSHGDDGKTLRRVARDLNWAGVLTSTELARALGREMVVHAAVAPGRLAESLHRDALRLSGFRSDSDWSVSDRSENR